MIPKRGPIPMLAIAVWHLQAGAGAMVTAFLTTASRSTSAAGQSPTHPDF